MTIYLTKILRYLLVSLGSLLINCAAEIDNINDFSVYKFAIDNLALCNSDVEQITARFPYQPKYGSKSYPVRIQIQDCPDNFTGCTSSHRKKIRDAIKVWNGYSVFGEFKLIEVDSNPHILVEWIEAFVLDDLEVASPSAITGSISPSWNFHRVLFELAGSRQYTICAETTVPWLEVKRLPLNWVGEDQKCTRQQFRLFMIFGRTPRKDMMFS